MLLTPLETFTAVVESCSFAKAGRRLKVSTASVTRRIGQLEAELGARLLNRNTRQVSTTEAGQKFYTYCIKMLNEHKQVCRSLLIEQETLVGRFKLGVPASLYHDYLLPSLPKLLDHYPDLELEIVQGNHINHLITQGFDLAIHCGELVDSELYGKKIGHWTKGIYCSPDYLTRLGYDKQNLSIDDLSSLTCLDHTDNYLQGWLINRQKDPKNRFVQPVHGQLKSNSSIALRQMACDGLGVVYLPSFVVEAEVTTGKLVQILSDYTCSTLPAYAVSLSSWQENLRLTLMFNWLFKCLKGVFVKVI